MNGNTTDKSIKRAAIAFLAASLVVVAVIGCSKTPGKGRDVTGNNGPGDNRQPVTVLRTTIGLNLADIASFAVVNTGTLGKSASAGATDTVTPSGPQLFALTLSGEVLEVKLVESSDTQAAGMVQQPPVNAIYSTATWILFSTPGFTIYKLRDDSSSEPISCQTIAARRSDGALFAGAIVLMGNPNADRRYDLVQPNAAGDLVYLGNHDPNIANKELIYALTLGGAGGPVATVAIDPWIYPEWFATNAAGDLFVIYYPSALDHNQETTLAQVVPVGGNSPVLLTGTGYINLAHGEFGGTDENAFYAEKTNSGQPNEKTVWVITRSGSSFVETPQVLSFPNASVYNGLYRLGDGLYLVSSYEKAIVRALVNGVVVANPTPVPITGTDHFIGVRGSFVQAAENQLVIFVSTGSGFKFVRHDGTTQQDIPIDPNIDVLDYTVAPSGAIDFTGRRADTQEKVRGEVAAGATNATVVSGGLLNPAQVVVFTRIN